MSKHATIQIRCVDNASERIRLIDERLLNLWLCIHWDRWADRVESEMRGGS